MSAEGGRVSVEAAFEPPEPRVLVAPSVAAQPGEKLSISIGIDDGENLAALSFSLQFNPEILGFGGAQAGQVVTDHEFSVAHRGGELVFSLKSPSGKGMQPGEGSVVRIAFETLVGGTSPLALGSASAVDVNGTAVKVGLVSGKVVVEEESVPRVLALPELVATVGEAFSVPVGLNEGKGIAALGFVLRWNPKLLRLGKLGPGSLLVDHKIESSAAEGALKVALVSPTKSSLREGKGTVLEIGFEPLQVGKTPLEIESAAASDPKGRAVKVSASNGAVRVDEGTKPPEPRNLSVTNRTVPDNESFSVPVLMDNGEGIASIRFALKWDPTILSFGQLTNGTLINKGQKVTFESGEGGLGGIHRVGSGLQLEPRQGFAGPAQPPTGRARQNRDGPGRCLGGDPGRKCGGSLDLRRGDRGRGNGEAPGTPQLGAAQAQHHRG